MVAKPRRWALLEFGCSPASLLRQDEHRTAQSRPYRLTEERGVASTNRPLICHFAGQAQAGSAMQNLRKERLDADEKCQAHMDRLHA